MKNTLKNLQKFIDTYQYFFVIGHEHPDGDCIGSQLACAGLLKKLQKQVFLLSSGLFTDTVAKLYSSLFYLSYSHIHGMPSDSTSLRDFALLCVDTSSYDRLGDVAKPLAHLPTAVIDHHASGHSFGTVQYIDVNAPANTLLVYRLFDAYKITPTQEDAHFILLGILTDTQFFRFVKSQDSESFMTAAKMVQLGASSAEIYKQMGYGHTFLSRKTIAKVLKRAFRVNNNRVVLTYIRHEDYLRKDDIPPSYEIYQLLQSAQKIEVIVYIQENLDANNCPVCKIGLRSHHKVDVSIIAKEFGGGGHARASGFSLCEPLLQVLEILKKYFDTLLIE